MKKETSDPFSEEEGILSTQSLDRILARTRPEELAAFLEENKASLIGTDKPFALFMRERIREKGMTQQEVFINADIGEKYGYKLISEEKHPRHRDTILRLCFGAKLTLKETQQALKCSGFRELYSRIPRDAVLMVALNRAIRNIHEINKLLALYGEEPLRPI